MRNYFQLFIACFLLILCSIKINAQNDCLSFVSGGWHPSFVIPDIGICDSNGDPLTNENVSELEMTQDVICQGDVGIFNLPNTVHPPYCIYVYVNGELQTDIVYYSNILFEQSGYVDIIVIGHLINGGTPSAATLQMYVYPTYNVFVEEQVCDANDAGIVVESFSTYCTGCDSIVTTEYYWVAPVVVESVELSCNPDMIGSDTTIVIGSTGCDSLITITITEELPMETIMFNYLSCNPSDTGTVVEYDYVNCEIIVSNIVLTDLQIIHHTPNVSCNPADTMTVYETDYDNCVLHVYTTDLIGPIVSQQEIWVDTCSNEPLSPDTLWYSSTVGNGCDSIVIIHYNVRPYPMLDIIQYPVCGEDTEVELFPWGGTGSHTVVWSDGSDDMVRSFSYDQWIDVSIIDDFGCQIDTSIYIDVWEPPVLELGDDIAVLLGDPVSITAIHTPGHVQWNLPSTIVEPDTSVGSNLKFVAVHSSEISAMVIDTNGCTASDDIVISVSSDYDVFIPNAFSPNGDGVNDTFHPFGGDHVLEVVDLHIYDRWGEEVFRRSHFTINDPSLGWTGTFRGEDMNNGVFAYWCTIRFIDGSTSLYKGDISLFR